MQNNIQKSIVFLYTNNKIFQTKINKKFIFQQNQKQ